MCDKCKAIAGPDYEKIKGEAEVELARVQRWVFASNALAIGAIALAVAATAETIICSEALYFYRGLVPALGMYLLAQACLIKYQQRVIGHARKAVDGLTDLLLQLSKARLFISVVRSDSTEVGPLN